MKKKNVVKKEVREKKTLHRSVIKPIKTKTPTKPVPTADIQTNENNLDVRNTPKKVNRKPKPPQIEIIKPVEEINVEVENNE